VVNVINVPRVRFAAECVGRLLFSAKASLRNTPHSLSVKCSFAASASQQCQELSRSFCSALGSHTCTLWQNETAGSVNKRKRCNHIYATGCAFSPSRLHSFCFQLTECALESNREMNSLVHCINVKRRSLCSSRCFI